MTESITPASRTGSGFMDFIRMLLRGAGQVMFQNNVWTGILFLCGIFVGAAMSGNILVGWGALLGLAVSTLMGFVLNLPDRDGEQGLWGFNGILVGCAFPTFLGSTPWMWFALALCAALTTWVRTGFNKVMAPWKVNSLTFPFVFCTWIFLLGARAMHAIPDTHMGTPELVSTFATVQNLNLWDILVYWLKGISQVFLIDSWITGLLFLIGLFISDRWAALWAVVGSAAGATVAIIFSASGSDIASGLYGFSPVLTGIALATVFYKPGLRSAFWALLGIVVTVFVQGAMNVFFTPFGIATLTAPFCVTTWLFLLPMFKYDEHEPDHSLWNGKKGEAENGVSNL